MKAKLWEVQTSECSPALVLWLRTRNAETASASACCTHGARCSARLQRCRRNRASGDEQRLAL